MIQCCKCCTNLCFKICKLQSSKEKEGLRPANVVNVVAVADVDISCHFKSSEPLDNRLIKTKANHASQWITGIDVG